MRSTVRAPPALCGVNSSARRASCATRRPIALSRGTTVRMATSSARQ